MKRTEAMKVGDIITKLLKEDNIDRQFNRYTVSRYVKNGVLYLHLSSAALRNELMMSRTALIKRLNEAVGSEVIHDIVIR